MHSQRLEQQYLKLLHRHGFQPLDTTLQELADQLYCSKRHMRNLLLKMQQEGWISWQAESGRGKRSALQLLKNEQQLLSDKADQLLESGRFADALRLLGEEKYLIAPLLKGRLGFSIRSDQQVLRVPYYRPMLNLYPGTPLRRSEQHLLRQICSGLTRIKEENGEVEPCLAHHWRQLDALNWRFYLRPAVQFHDGKELNATDVVVSLARAVKLPLFSHLHKVQAAGPLIVEFSLSDPDPLFPALLASLSALILPADHAGRSNFGSFPVGTGPYHVVDNDQWHLRLKAFDGYFGLRALLDEVEILMWPELTNSLDHSAKRATTHSRTATPPADLTPSISSETATWLSSSLSDSEYVSGAAAEITGRTSDLFKEMFLEKGGYFLLCDSRSPHWQLLAQRRWLHELLNPYLIAQHIDASIRHLWVPAASVLPGWCHSIVPCLAQSPFETGGSYKEPRATLRLAYHQQHPEFPMLTEAMKTILARENIELVTVELDYQRWALGDAEVDIWLGTVNFPVPETWHVGAWLLGTQLLRQSITGGDNQQLEQWHKAWRAGELDSQVLVWQVIQSGWLQPLFHHWMRLKGPAQAQGIHLNNLGWFDFQSTWLEPTETYSNSDK
ncbi:MAG TPA: SgrR family transcriptional regulator [Psychromonas sp.]